MKELIFVDVDTQYDFVMPDGKLYVKGAESLMPKWDKLTKFAKEKYIKVYSTMDSHLPSDRELQGNGGPWPDHCMRGTPGAQKVVATRPVKPLIVENLAMKDAQWKKVPEYREFVIEKQENDAFTNPNMDRLVSNAGTAVVYGVATDYCVRLAVNGLLKRNIKVFVAADAIAAVDARAGEKCLADFAAKGANLFTTDTILERARRGLIA